MFEIDPITFLWSQITPWLFQTHSTSKLINPINNIKQFYTNQLLLLKLYFVGLKYIYIIATFICG